MSDPIETIAHWVPITRTQYEMVRADQEHRRRYITDPEYRAECDREAAEERAKDESLKNTPEWDALDEEEARLNAALGAVHARRNAIFEAAGRYYWPEPEDDDDW